MILMHSYVRGDEFGYNLHIIVEKNQHFALRVRCAQIPRC
jgi:hypothetical protein